MLSSDRSESPTVRGRAALLLGAGFAVLGVIVYAVQISLGRLTTPWYMPALALLGALFVVISVWKKASVWRVLALFAIALLAAGEWGLMYAFRLPPYAGPLIVGRPFPQFETSRADGSVFSQTAFVGAQNNVLVFFRGRW